MSEERGEETRALAAGFRNGFSASVSFESEIPLTTPHPGSPREPRHRLRQTARLTIAATLFALLLATMAALLAATVARCRREGGAGCLIPRKAIPLPWGGVGMWPPDLTVTRIAFGSCTGYDIRNQPIWEEGIIPSQPDAFVWLGDMYYADEPAFECNSKNSNASACQCQPDFLRQPPFTCQAGDMDNARDKMVAQIEQPGYQAYLKYSCPGWDPTQGTYVPAGDDLAVCPRPILGVYDDHDYAVNNFNRRLPDKHLFKQIFLDAIGTSPTSPRRAAQQGIHWSYTLNPGSRQQEVQLVLLDERYQRAPLPCEVREDWCRQVVFPAGKKHYDYAWCDDFLNTGGASGSGGSCCKADGAIAYGWCKQEGSRADPLWQVACNRTSPAYGQQALVVQDNKLVPRDVADASQEEDSTFCELLGPHQRRWLESVLSASSAPVRVIASGSVLLGSSGLNQNSKEDWQALCSGDDWDCYRPAQLALMHTIQRHAAASGGCWVVITGDYHYSDIKVASPGTSHPYSEAYETAGWVTPIYQVMASGMTNSTARPLHECEGYRKENSGLRIEGDCGFVKVPAFGMLQFDWAKRQLSMQIRAGEGSVGGSVQQELTISLDTCLPV